MVIPVYFSCCIFKIIADRGEGRVTPKSYYTDLGDTINFFCKSYTNDIIWTFRNSFKLPNNTQDRIVDTDYSFFYSILRITDVQPHNVGIYTCYGMDDKGYQFYDHGRVGKNANSAQGCLD